MNCKQCFTVCLTFYVLALFANDGVQPYIVRGRIMDGTTLSPLAYATVYVKETNAATITNFEGSFTLPVLQATDTLIIRLLGYESLEVAYDISTNNQLVILLQPNTIQLDEIVVRPGKSQVLVLLDSVQAHKAALNADNKSFAEYVSENNLVVFFRRFADNPSKRKKFFFHKAFDNYAILLGDSASKAIPGYSTTRLVGVQKSKMPPKTVSVELSSETKALAFEASEFIQQLAELQTDINFSNEQVTILDKKFISPTASYGPLFYKYKMVDTVLIDSLRCIGVEFQPKNNLALCFSGKIWISADTYVLKRVSIETSGQTGINFVNRIKIEQNMQPIANVWVASSTRLLFDAANIYALSTQYQRAHRFYQQKPASFFSGRADESLLEWAVRSEDSFLKSDTLLARSEQMLDSLKLLPSVSVSAQLIETAVRGYYNLGKVELGPYLLLYNSNPVEGSRFRMGFHTKDAFSEGIILSGYLAYGTLDKQFKYAGTAEAFLRRASWMKLGVQYLDDVRNLGAIDAFYERNTFLTLASSGGSDQMQFSRIARAWFETDISPVLNCKVVYSDETFRAASKELIFAYYTNCSRTHTSSTLKHQSVDVQLCWQPGILWSYDDNRRFPVDFNFTPRFEMGYRYGWMNNCQNFHRLKGQYIQRYQIPQWGQMKLKLGFEKSFNAVPYPLLSVLDGNETIFRSESTYNLMNYGEFIADELVEAYWIWHFDGAILGRIPLIKRLDWRLLTDVHAAWGDFGDAENGWYHPITNPTGILPITDASGNELTQFGKLSGNKPYVEIAYGIENVFKFIRVDAIHRLSYREHANVGNFGVKVSGVFRF